MICEKCGDRGFTEQEHGLVMVVCDCEKGEALRALVFGESGKAPHDAVSIGGGIPEGMEIPDSVTTTSDTDFGKLLKQNDLIGYADNNGVYHIESEAKIEEGRINDNSDSGTGQPNNITRSGDPGKPKRTRKPKAKKKAGAKSG